MFVDGESRRGMGEELQALAKEVARVETVRNYAGYSPFLVYHCINPCY